MLEEMGGQIGAEKKIEENGVAWTLGNGFAATDLIQQNRDLPSDFKEDESRAKV